MVLSKRIIFVFLLLSLNHSAKSNICRTELGLQGFDPSIENGFRETWTKSKSSIFQQCTHSDELSPNIETRVQTSPCINNFERKILKSYEEYVEASVIHVSYKSPDDDASCFENTNQDPTVADHFRNGGVIILYQGYCLSKNFRINNDIPGTFTDDFMNALRNLTFYSDLPSDPKALEVIKAFHEMYGTHVVTTAFMGTYQSLQIRLKSSPSPELLSKLPEFMSDIRKYTDYCDIIECNTNSTKVVIEGLQAVSDTEVRATPVNFITQRLVNFLSEPWINRISDDINCPKILKLLKYHNWIGVQRCDDVGLKCKFSTQFWFDYLIKLIFSVNCFFPVQTNL